MTTPAEPSGPTSGGNVFTRKIGPLPMWAWMAIALLVALFYYLYKKNKSSSSSSGSSTSDTGGSAGTTDQSLVPQFVNQTYTNSTAPAMPSVITVQNGGTSSAGGTINMPNVVGQSTTQAQAALKGAGLSSGTLSGPKVAKGQATVVAFQNPKAGAAVSPTTPITIGYETPSGSGKSQTETQMINGKPVTKKVSSANPPGNPPATS
jgi:hypothetical protein